ncbi:hypothetical protein ACE1TF_19910 [Geomicrobium sp. JSM 1781026]|uniref:hypothetical protein n=1 Tax=Geomicrobium sp. JSM 1781026 TaxID=3344580 RepID=UPI0035BF0396
MNEIQKRPDRDAEENMGLGIVAYILFFVPLLAAKDSAFARHHANQGLLLLLLVIAVNVIGNIPLIGWLLYPVGMLLVLVLFVVGIVNATQKTKKSLPIIGGINLIK